MARINQARLEEKIVELGKSRAEARMAARMKKNFSQSNAGSHLVDAAFSRLLEGIIDEFPTVRTKIAIFNRKSATPSLVTAVGISAAVDCLTSRMSFPAACTYVGKQIDDETRFIELRRSNAKYMRELQRTQGEQSIAKTRKAVRDLFVKYMGVDTHHGDRAKAGMYVLFRVLHWTDMFELEQENKPNGHVVRILVPTPTTKNWITKAVELEKVWFPYHLPCVEVPKDWDGPVGGGYVTGKVVSRPIVKTRSREHILSLDRPDMAPVYNAVNLLQRVPWQINDFIFESQRHILSLDITMAGCSSSVFEKMGKMDPNLSTEQRRAYRRVLARLRNRNRKAKLTRTAWAKTIATGDLMRGNTLYYVHKLDFRGRVYSVATKLNPQNNDQAVSLLEFHQGQRMESDRDWFWAEVTGYNLYMKGKTTFDTRRKWVAENHENILQSAKDPFGYKWWEAADSPMQFLAWARQYQMCREDSSTEWRTPVMVDGTCNGLQIFSFMLKDEEVGVQTNCVPSPEPQDIYMNVAKEVTNRLRADHNSSHAQTWMSIFKDGIPRSAAKTIAMALAYGITRWGAVQTIADWWDKYVMKHEINALDFDMWPAINYLGNLVFRVSCQMILAARNCTRWMQECARIMSKNQLNMKWKLPSGFEVWNNYHELKHGTVTMSFGRRGVGKVQYDYDTPLVNASRQELAITANVVQSVEASILSQVVNRLGGIPLRTVHDEYGSLPRYMDLVSRTIRETYVDTFRNDLLADIRHQWCQQLGNNLLPRVPRSGRMDILQVLDSPYFFA